GISSNAPWVEEVWVSYTQRHDVGAEAILAPGDTVSQHQQVTPRVVVRNFGTSVETFPVTMRIGSDYNQTVNDVTLAPGQVDTVEFAEKWTAGTVGDFPTRAYTRMATDEDRSNDTVYGVVTVNVPVHDVGAYEILAPVGLLDSGVVVTPRVMVRNFGSSEEVFPVTLKIGSGYSRTVSGIRLSGGEEAMVTFPDWTAAPIGRYEVRAYTHMYNDDNRSNDSVMDTVVVYVNRHDVGPTGIRVPARKVLVGNEVWPSVVVQNFGGYAETFDLEVTIEDEARAVVFREQEQVAGLELGEARLVTFTEHSWTASPVGNYRAWAVTKLAGDENPANDEFGPEGVMVRDIPPWPGGWAEVETMPSAPSGKPVKRGGWLTGGPEATIFAAKGNKTSDFYVFNPVANTWTSRAEIMAGIEGKLPDKGCRGAWDGGDHVYMTKGANTFGFHCYHIAADSWSRRPDVPEGPGRKKVKGGTDMVYVVRGDTGWVYLLKGYRTEFYRYNTVAARWDTLPDAPSRVKPKWDKGSWLVYDEANAIYAHQAKYYDRATNHHYMFRYDIDGDSWETAALTGMPLLGLHAGRLRKKKAKDGSAGAWDDGAISAIKGGNTQQFFTYNPETDSWTELDTIPALGTTGRKKLVKHGADLVSYGNGVFFALKGNKTREMWRYCFAGAVGPRPRRGSAAMAGPAGLRELGLQVRPNPVASGFATVRYSVSTAGPGRLSVYDAGGRRVADLALHVERSGAVSLDLRHLPAGSYLARLDAGGRCTSRRFVLY
ncbi:T9SS type A sorting domain-containing protein, partial [candidate division WOR-3 bacterium]|nr:T9SS type A sorting domain-containing protein [candidate division WOR-3 bacterium]